MDILYVTFSSPRGKVTTVENENGDILRLDPASGEVLGVTIQLFMCRMKRGEKINIAEIGELPFSQSTAHFLESRRIENVKHSH
jgi:hypothetical protein